jgi:hypothetical protein
MMRFLLGRVLDLDLDSSVLQDQLLAFLSHESNTAYVDIWQLGNFTSH